MYEVNGEKKLKGPHDVKRSREGIGEKKVIESQEGEENQVTRRERG